MSWTPIVNKAFKLPQLEEYINSLDFVWRPSLITWHNTGLPTIQQWEDKVQQDIKNGVNPPGQSRINSLVSYYRDQQGWPSGPHFFVYKDVVWAFTPANKKGTHSPSWNGTAIGIEMIGDFAKEDDDSGAGLLIKNNTIALTAMLCEKIGLDPQTCIRLHKEDKKTTHDCPGKNIAKDKQKMIDAVYEYMGHAGGHDDKEPAPPKVRNGTVDVPANDSLNLREKSSASSSIVIKLGRGTKVKILNEAMNGATKWLYVEYADYKGWVAAKYIKEAK